MSASDLPENAVFQSLIRFPQGKLFISRVLNSITSGREYRVGMVGSVPAADLEMEIGVQELYCEEPWK